MQANVVLLYLVTAGMFFLVLFAAFWLDSSTSKRHSLSWIVVLVGSLFWGVVLPLALAERLRKLMRQRVLTTRPLPFGRFS